MLISTLYNDLFQSRMKLIKFWLVSLLIILYSIYLYRENYYSFFVSEDLVQVWDTNIRYILRQLFPNSVVGYRPVMFIWWWLGHLLFGYTPFAFRWFIVLLHAVNSIIVYTLIARISKSSIAGLSAALLFLSMPIHSDAINWLSAASNQVTCGFFYLLTIMFYQRYINYYNRNIKAAKSVMIYCIILMLLALATNEVALTIIFSLFGFDIIINRNKSDFLRQLRYRMGPFWIAWIAFLVWRTLAVRGIGGYGPSVHLRFGEFLFQTSEDIVRMLTIPWSNYKLLSDIINIAFENIITLIIAGVIICVILWNGRLGLVILVASVLPVLNIPAYHRLYIPAAGFAIAIGLSLAAILRLPPQNQYWLRGMLSALLGASVIFGSAQQSQALAVRNREWRRASTITSTVVKQTLELVSAPPSGSVFYYHGLPKNLGNGVQVFNWGLRQALQAAYNDRSLKAFRVKKNPDAFYRLERSPEQIVQNTISETNQIFLVFDVNSMKLDRYLLEDFIFIVNTSMMGPEY